jgi:mannan endo-1,4-beta-mannosidase
MAVAAAIGVSMSAVLPASTADAEDESIIFTSECEDLELNGSEVWTSIYDRQMPGYSGTGFVYLTSGSFKFTVEAPEDGMYEITTRCAQILDQDGREQTISINGSQYKYRFPYMEEWTDYSFGVHRLQAGENTIEILPQYGYACYDTITVKIADLPALDCEPTLVDQEATTETQNLMNYLTSVYGEHIISGQQEIYGGGNDGNTELEFDYIYDISGKYPAIRGFDMMNYNPLYGWDDQTVERMIEWTTERNGICTACWHINVPINFDSYEIGDAVDWKECTYKPTEQFNTANAVIEGTKEYEYVQLTIKYLAEQFQRLQDAGVPVIFRPYHEAEGNGGLNGEGSWFWWSSAGADVYIKLWKQLYTTLTEEYGIHNLIWEFNSYTYDTSAGWYPGDDLVDIVAYDKYNVVYNRNDGLSNCPNVDAISNIFYQLVDLTDGKKMVSMAENDTVPTVENLTTEKAGWLYFCPWYGEHLMDSMYNDPDTLAEIYKSDYCITLDELPADWRTASGEVSTGTTTEPAETTTTVSETTLATETTAESTATTTKPVETTTASATETEEVTSTTEGTTVTTTKATTTTEAVTTTETKPSETTTTSATTTKETTTSTQKSTTATTSQSTASTTTASTGTTTTTSSVTTTEETVQDVVYGDMNQDGKISLIDIIMLNKYLSKIITFNAQQTANADCCKDGAIDTEDLNALISYIVELTAQLPIRK